MRADAAMLGTSGHARVPNDFYGTVDTGCTYALLSFLDAQGRGVAGKTVWEPAAGQGHISKVCRLRGAEVVESDIAPQTEDAVRFDFTTGDRPHLDFGDKGADFVITNPPYKRAVIDAFMSRCVALANAGKTCALLMRNEVDSAGTRHKFFTGCPVFDTKLTLLWRPRWIAGSTGSPRHNYAWFIWSPAAVNRAAELHHAVRPKVNG